MTQTAPSDLDLYFDEHSSNPEVRRAYTSLRHAVEAMRLCGTNPRCRAAASWARGFETYALERLKAIAEP